MSTGPVVDETSTGPSRRTTLKKGLAVGGAALWAVPAVQALSVTSASAQLTSGVGGGGGGGGSGEPTGKYVSHGFVLVLCDGLYYAAKIESNGHVSGSGNQDLTFLANLGYADISREPLPDGFVGTLDVYKNELALKLVVPGTCEIVGLVAVSFDGSFENKKDPTSDKYGFATIVGNTVYFRASDDDD